MTRDDDQTLSLLRGSLDIKTIFVRGPVIGYRLLFLVCLSVALIFLDHRYDAFSILRYQFTELVEPLFVVADAPQQLSDWGETNLRSRESLVQEVKELRAQSLVLRRRIQQVSSLSAENVRLRELLNSSKAVDERVLIAEVIGLDPDPFRHKVLINKGYKDGVREGQSILDARGLMGQVESAN